MPSFPLGADRTLPTIPVVAGPTGVGKTEACVTVAERIGAEIISADSRQVYRGLAVGTAAPSPLQSSRVPHHLIGVLDPQETWSAGAFARQAAGIIGEVRARGKRVMVVGGSGFYLRAFTEGLFEEPDTDAETRRRVRHRLQRRLDEEGLETLFRELLERDPGWAAALEPTDTQRVLRGLEAFELHGKPLSELQRTADKDPPLAADWRVVVLMRERSDLYRRLDARVSRMLEAGWLREAEELRVRGVPADAPGLSGLGYAELYDNLDGARPLDEAAERIRREHRRYANRQMTWFRSLTDARFVHLKEEDGPRETATMILNTLGESADPNGGEVS